MGRAGQRIGLMLGPLLALGLQWIGPPEGLSTEAWYVVSLAVLMVTWWVTEAIPIAATALLPLAALPLMGVSSTKDAAAPYADPIIFMFIGGFMLAACVERWRLHERIALGIASWSGGRPVLLVGCFMLASAVISMWISNTATTLMLAPIALGAARALTPDGKADLALGGALLLGVAHAASIAGIGTPVGSPTNLIAIGFLERAGDPMAFTDWMTRAIPLMLVMLPVGWLVLCAPLFRRGAGDSAAVARVVSEALRVLGPLSRPEARIGAVFTLVALAWMFRLQLNELPLLGNLSDAGIAVIGAVLLFLVPSGRGQGEKLIDWPTAERIPWGIAILFGGGALARHRHGDHGARSMDRSADCRARWRFDVGLDRDSRDHDHPDFRAREQCRYADVDAARRWRGRSGHGHAIADAGIPGGDRSELRLHVTGGDGPECDRVFFGCRDAEADADGRLRAQSRCRNRHSRLALSLTAARSGRVGQAAARVRGVRIR